MNDELTNFVTNLEQQNEDLRSQNNELRGAVTSQMATQEDKNLVEFQLDTSHLIERIEHYLKGEVIGIDKDGNEVWITPKDNELIVFNDYGVSTIMLTIQQYITKDTKLSNYKEQRIYEILAELGDELRKYILCNYERMGLTSEFKKSKYGLIVITLLNMIETAYRNSIDALTLKESNTGRSIVQNEGHRIGQQMQMPSKRRGFMGWLGVR